MTNKERALKNLRQMYYGGRYIGTGSIVPSEVLEDFGMAIKVLEKKSCGDAISRRRVFSAIHNTHLPKKYEEPLWNKISDLPSVAPIRPKGEWIDFAVEPEKIFNQHYYACPHCDHGATYFVGGTENWWCTETPNFCPHCGADMRGEKDAT